jgi:hypothetical protein
VKDSDLISNVEGGGVGTDTKAERMGCKTLVAVSR